jgi:gamma-glutamyl-gamma-aminobutyrate hydrolase PuuD
VSRWEDISGERSGDYLESVAEAGGEPVELRFTGTIEGLDGLILTGGYDIDPAGYSETPHQKLTPVDAARDAFETGLLRAALARDLPVLAICRGHQLLNVALGGRLLQHIDAGNHRADYKTEGYPSRWHLVRIETGSKLAGILGAGDIEVNSRHHQGVLPEMLASGLRATAFSPDGLVEAVEGVGPRWLLGVQWHPERPEAARPNFRNRREVFGALVAESRKAAQPA